MNSNTPLKYLLRLLITYLNSTFLPISILFMLYFHKSQLIAGAYNIHSNYSQYWTKLMVCSYLIYPERRTWHSFTKKLAMKLSADSRKKLRNYYVGNDTWTNQNNLSHLVRPHYLGRSAEIKRTGGIDASGVKDHRGIKISDHSFFTVIDKITKEHQNLIMYRDFSKFDFQLADTGIAKRID